MAAAGLTVACANTEGADGGDTGGVVAAAGLTVVCANTGGVNVLLSGDGPSLRRGKPPYAHTIDGCVRYIEDCVCVCIVTHTQTHTHMFA